MRTSGRIPWAGLVSLTMAAFALSGCIAAGVATVAAGGGLGYAFTKDPPQTAATTTPASGGAATSQPATTGALDNRGYSGAASEPSYQSQPTNLVGSTAPVERVEVQPLQ
jgi:hypothetical protein